jgi:hypothetical protein
MDVNERVDGCGNGYHVTRCRRAAALLFYSAIHDNQGEGLMRRLTTTLAAAAFVLGSMALSASAQTQQAGASSLQSQAQNATPIHKAACDGWDQGCPPGKHRVCAPYRCWCARC